MTSRATEIQTLIVDIDGLLANKGKRLVRVLSIPAQEPRLVLERVRDFLTKLHSELNDAVAQTEAAQSSPSAHADTVTPNSDFSELLVPLRSELQALLDERKNLVSEIRQLEQQRSHNFSLAQQIANQERMIAEFLQVLASRIKSELLLVPQTNTVNSPEQVERLSVQSEQRTDIDASINTVFEALERNIQTKSESLTQALERMHGQGVQSEELLKTFIDNWTDQLQLANRNITSQLLSINTTAFKTTSASEQVNVARSPNLASEQALKSASLKSQLEQEPIAAAATASELPELGFNPPDNNTTPDLDALLLELNQSTATTPPTSTNPVKPSWVQTPEAKGDEVEQLYASLFSTENGTTTQTNPINVTQIPTPSTTPTAPEVTADVVAPVSTSELEQDDISTAPKTKVVKIISIESIDTPPVSTTDDTSIPTNNLPVVRQDASIIEDSVESNQENEELTSVPDPWLHEVEAGLLDLHSLEGSFGVEFTEHSGVNWETFINVDNTGKVLPEQSSNTITALTDLSFVEESEVESELSPLRDSTIATGIGEPNRDITDSPSEILLSQAAADLDAAMPDIALDDNQLQQLDRDLTNFDAEKNLSSGATAPILSSTQVNITAPGNTDPNLEQNQTAAALLSENGNNLEVSADLNSLVPGGSSIDIIQIAPNTQESAWYLGIDLGTTGISAALLNRSTSVVYPLYWSQDTENDTATVKRSFRLPAEVYLPAAAGNKSENDPLETQARGDDIDASSTSPTQNLFSAELKPYLQIALPYRSERQRTIPLTEGGSAQESTQKWEPVLQLNEVATVPLVWMVRSLSKLLLTLKSDRNSTTLGLTAAAMGLNADGFRNVIDNIAGVICSCPSNWSEQYRFNIREAILISKLVPHPQQVFFIEEAIASLLSELDGANGESVKLNSHMGSRPTKSSDHHLVGNTLVMNIGAGASEMALVDLPENLLELAHSDFMLHSFTYGGKGIEQDIVCQLLLPPKWRKSRQERENEPVTASIGSNPWHWQPSISGLDRTRLSSLKWEELTLPRAGEPDIAERIRLQQSLESSRLGKALLDAATAMKLILQHQESFSLELADQRWVVQRRDLESQIFVPFVRRLNRELNRLLVARGIPTEAINQAILTGGVASLGAVSRWLRQKLPNARIIQDLYLGENGTPTCSRVAYGLSMLPLHPQVLEIPRQQYTDYFLFTELLRLLPEHALSFSEVIQLFEERGINTRSCQQRLLAFLEGELPAGLVPNSTDSIWLTPSSIENSDYKAHESVPLFEKQGSLTYRPNMQQIQTLRRYLDAIKTSTQQSLEEPYTVNFAFIGV